MPREKDLKRIIRSRMKKTGESYTTARSHVIAKRKPEKTAESPTDFAALAGMRDDALVAKTGRTWREWVRLLDGANAATLPHRDIAVLVRNEFGAGDWWAQMVTVGYERIKGLRDRGQRRSGAYEAGKSKTFNVPVDALFSAWAGAAMRRRWLDGVKATVRTATAPKSMRLQWPDGTIVVAGFMPKGTTKSAVAVVHTKLRDKAACDNAKKFWAGRLDALTQLFAAQVH